MRQGLEARGIDGIHTIVTGSSHTRAQKRANVIPEGGGWPNPTQGGGCGFRPGGFVLGMADRDVAR